MDALLVAHLVAEHLSAKDDARTAEGASDTPSEDLSSHLRALFTLSTVAAQAKHPPLPPISGGTLPSPDTIDYLFNTIGNNHWVVTSSYLHSIANAVFALASRSFNHSCLPNACPSYKVDGGRLWMDVRALRKIEVDEEVCMLIRTSVQYFTDGSAWIDRCHLRGLGSFAPSPPGGAEALLRLRLHLRTMSDGTTTRHHHPITFSGIAGEPAQRIRLSYSSYRTSFGTSKQHLTTYRRHFRRTA